MASPRSSKLGEKVLNSSPILRFKKSSVALVLIVFLLALTMRMWHITSANYLDHNGDSYHHWLTSYLTATHGYRHTDFKGSTLDIAWLPLYHYMIAILMNTFNVYSLDVQHAFNILLGSLTCVIVFAIARQSGSKGIAFAAGLALAIQPWFVDVTTLGVSEVAAVFLLTLGIMLFLRGKVTLAAIPVALAMLVRYEAWIFALTLLVIGAIQKRESHRHLTIYAMICAAVVVGWSLNSWTQTGQLFSWYTTQSATVKWDRLFTSDVGSVPEYARMLVEVTSGMFLLGVVVGLVRNDRNIRLLLSLELAYLLIIALQFLRGTVPFQVRFLSYIFPLTAVLSSNVAGFVAKILRCPTKKTVLSFFILAVVVVYPVYSQYWIVSPTVDQTKLDGHVAAELIAGQLLSRSYANGTVLSDSPTIIYYSHLDPAKFYSTSSLDWYSQAWNKSELAAWMRERHVKYLVWQNVSYSSTWWLFPELSHGSNLKLGDIMFNMVAWTNSDFGPIYVYEINYQ